MTAVYISSLYETVACNLVAYHYSAGLLGSSPITHGSDNQRALFEKLELEFDLAIRGGLLLSVVMADIDHFKRINDDFGHSTGDIMIKDMARVLSQSAGNNDSVGRLSQKIPAETASLVGDR